MSDDIVAELDEWIEQSGRSDWRAMLQRARGEIVKLRNALHGAELSFVTACNEIEALRVQCKEMAVPVIDTRCV